MKATPIMLEIKFDSLEKLQEIYYECTESRIKSNSNYNERISSDD